jgi:hypothetical protein
MNLIVSGFTVAINGQYVALRILHVSIDQWNGFLQAVIQENMGPIQHRFRQEE